MCAPCDCAAVGCAPDPTARGARIDDPPHFSHGEEKHDCGCGRCCVCCGSGGCALVRSPAVWPRCIERQRGLPAASADSNEALDTLVRSRTRSGPGRSSSRCRLLTPDESRRSDLPPDLAGRLSASRPWGSRSCPSDGEAASVVRSRLLRFDQVPRPRRILESWQTREDARAVGARAAGSATFTSRSSP